MAALKTVPRKPVSRKAKRRPTSKMSRGSAADLDRRVAGLNEQLEIMLPEIMARVAALEHLLLTRELCTRDDLRRARDFVRTQEAEPAP